MLYDYLRQVRPGRDIDSDVESWYALALGLHVTSLRWLWPAQERAACRACGMTLTPRQIMRPELQGHCPDCAIRLDFPINPPF